MHNVLMFQGNINQHLVGDPSFFAWLSVALPPWTFQDLSVFLLPKVARLQLKLRR